MPNLSERLAILQTQSGILKKDVAKDIDISVMAYYRYETGERMPDGNTIIKLCRYFNVSADYLLGLSDEPRPLREEDTHGSNH